MIDHEAIIKQQNLDQAMIEEFEYGNEYGSMAIDPSNDIDDFNLFINERYSYGEEEIEVGRRQKSFKAVKLG